MKRKDYPLLDACDPSTCSAAKIAWIQRRIHSIYRQHLQSFDITTSQLSMLFILSKMNGLKQLDLCRILALEKSTVSRNLIRLIQRDLLFKNDLREVSITESGKALLEQIIPYWEKAQSEVNSRLGGSGESELDALITKLSIA